MSDKMDDKGYWLEVFEIGEKDIEFPFKCDGCGKQSIIIGEKWIGSIESCCGSCTRNLCGDCIKTAYEMLGGK
jgi:hypothetical protein